ncbi:MAG TPA: hypothetical protein PKZ92_03585 [Candidatus Woesebacteria bacterium]|jgi:hypothetical protein|nr:hypothetical protein [Candidatus Shapirobacteria bacterium]HOR02309.1 hypothetical protein [Candidatus Woesebacteria bacterium]
MNNNDRNVRTLIICFVVALSVLVPMRMNEAVRESRDWVRVLGEEVVEESVMEDYVVDEGIVTEVYTEAEGMTADELLEYEGILEDNWQNEEIILPNAK